MKIQMRCKDVPEKSPVGKYMVLTTSINYASPLQLLLKRILDIIGGFAGCILTAAAFLFVAPVICLKSPGSVFFEKLRYEI